MSNTQIITVIVAIAVGLIFFYFLWVRSPRNRGKLAKPTSVSAIAKVFDGDYSSAINDIKTVILNNNATPEIYLILGYLYRKLGEYNKAAQTHELLFNLPNIDTEFKHALITEIARDYLYAHMPNKSLQLLQTFPDALYTPDNLRIAAIASLSIKDYDKAILYSSKYEKIEKDRMVGFFAKTMIAKAMATNDNDKVKKYINKALDEEKTSRAARFIKADIMVGKEKESKVATEYFNIFKENLVRDINDLKTIEDAFFKIGKEKELKDFISTEFDKSSHNPFIYIYLAESYMRNDNKDKAFSVMEKYLGRKDAKLIAFTYYASIKKDVILDRLALSKRPFICKVCNTKYDAYHDDCTVCKSFDSIILR